MTRVEERERAKKVRAMLLEGKSVEEIMRETKMGLGSVKRLLESKWIKAWMEKQRALVALRRRIALEHYDMRRDMELAAELMRGGDPEGEARLAKVIRQRQESETREVEESAEREISDEEAREAIRRGAERFRQERA